MANMRKGTACRLTSTWEENIKKRSQRNWMEGFGLGSSGSDHEHQWTLTNSVTNLRVPKGAGNFLNI